MAWSELFADGSEQNHETIREAYLGGGFPDPEINAPALGEAMRPFSELLPEAFATDAIRTLCLAHMDACLEEGVEARAFLEGDFARTFTARGIEPAVA